MEVGTVAIHAVTLVPLLMLADRVVDAHPVPPRARVLQRRFDRRREQQPVVEAGRMHARRFQRLHDMTARRRVDVLPQRLRRTQNRLRQERGVDERLRAVGEVETIRRRRIDRGRERLQRQFAILRAQPALGRVVWREFEPRRNAAEQPPERLQMRHLRAPLAHARPGRRLDRHPRVQPPLRQIDEHRIREPRRHRHPIRTIRRTVGRRRRRRGRVRRRTGRRGLLSVRPSASFASVAPATAALRVPA